MQWQWEQVKWMFVGMWSIDQNKWYHDDDTNAKLRGKRQQKNKDWEPDSNELGTCFIFVPTLETRTGPEPPTVIFEDSHNSYLAKAIAQWGKIHFDWVFIIFFLSCKICDFL